MRRHSTWWLVLLCAFVLGVVDPAFEARAFAEPQAIRSGERDTMAVLVAYPTNQLPTVQQSEIVDALDAELRTVTSLMLKPVPTSIAACRGQLYCWVEAALTSEGDAKGSSGLLVVVSVRTTKDGGDSVVSVLVDLTRARPELERLSHDDPDWRLEANARLFERAHLLSHPPIPLEPKDLRSSFAENLIASFKDALLERGYWKQMGTLDIETNAVLASIELDKKVVGTTTLGVTRILDIRSGDRELRLLHRDFEPWVEQILVEPGADLYVRAQLAPKEERPVFGPSWHAWAVGSGSLALGAALVALGAVQLGANDATCVSLEATGECDDLGMRRIGAPSSKAQEGQGPLTIPLGISLILGGATFFGLDSWIGGGRREFDWRPTTGGIVAAGIVYAAFEIANAVVRSDR